MAYTKITYRPVVGGGETPQEFPQTLEQAMQSIGVNMVAGFRLEREETKTEEGAPLVRVSVYGSRKDTDDVHFGTFEFHGRM